MKKLLLTTIAFVFVLQYAVADQLQWVTKEEAEATIKYLKENKVKKALLWCACCDDDKPVLLKIKKIEMKYTGYDNFYEVVFTGKLEDGSAFSQGVDLAYIHIRFEDWAYSIGVVMKFECDPCTGPFFWDKNKRKEWE